MSDANPNDTVVDQQSGNEPTGDTITIPVPPQAQPAAVDPQVDPSTGEPQGRTFTAEDIERARREEKDKLYPRLQQMETELQRITREREEREAAEAAAREAAEEEARKAAEAEMDVRSLFEAKNQEWEQKFSALTAQQEAERALFEKERTFNQVQEYRRQRIEQEAENLMPELLDLVTGNTQEEIEESIALVRTKTDAILEQMRGAVPAPPAPPQRGASATGAPPVGPMDNESAYQTLTAADIAAMDMNEYAKYRDTLLAGLSDRNRNKGLYG